MAATPNTLSTSEYWMSPDALTIDLNALDNPQYLQVSLLAGSVITAYRQDVIDYDASLNYRKWTLQAYNNFFDRTDRAYVYAQLEKEGTTALIIYSYDILELTEAVTSDTEGSREVYNVYLGTISSSVNSNGESIPRTWEDSFKTGSLSTDKNRDEEQLGEWAKMFRLNKVTDMIEVLKDMTSAVIHKLTVPLLYLGSKKREISALRTTVSEDEDMPIDDKTIPSLKYLIESTEAKFHRKDKTDINNFLQKFLGGIILPFVNSKSFTSGILGSGFTLREDENGISYLEVDKMMVRMKAIFQVLEILKVELGGASFLFNASGARATITKVEQIEQEAYFIDGDKGYFPNEDEAYFPDIYRCYFMTDDGETAVENLFKEGDFVRSQTFNIKAGVHENVSNHYWWRKVVGVGKDYIDISSVNYQEDSDIPKEGDVIVQLGNDRDEDRQSAIVLSAYGEGAPYLTMYQGINSYSLKDKDIFTIGYDNVKKECYLKNYGRAYIGARDGKVYFDFSNNKLAIKADSFIFSTGETVKDKLESNEQEIGKVSERISSEVKLLNDQISLKVSSDTFNSAIDQITESVSSEIKLVKDEISLKVSSTDLEDAIDGINSQLIQTGIDITKKTVTVTAQTFFVNNSNGTPIAVFTTDSSGKPILKTECIDVESLKVKHLDGADGTFEGILKAKNIYTRISKAGTDIDANGTIDPNTNVTSIFGSNNSFGIESYNTIKMPDVSKWEGLKIEACSVLVSRNDLGLYLEASGNNLFKGATLNGYKYCIVSSSVLTTFVAVMTGVGFWIPDNKDVLYSNDLSTWKDYDGNPV